MRTERRLTAGGGGNFLAGGAPCETIPITNATNATIPNPAPTAIFPCPLRTQSMSGERRDERFSVWSSFSILSKAEGPDGLGGCGGSVGGIAREGGTGGRDDATSRTGGVGTAGRDGGGGVTAVVSTFGVPTFGGGEFAGGPGASACFGGTTLLILSSTRSDADNTSASPGYLPATARD